MSNSLYYVIISAGLIFIVCMVWFTIVLPYQESEIHCKSIGKELYGWTPGGKNLTCSGLENDEVVKIGFEKINGKYYSIKGG